MAPVQFVHDHSCARPCAKSGASLVPVTTANTGKVLRGVRRQAMTGLALVAIGGNSLVKDQSHQAPRDQWQMVRETATHIGAMIASGWNVVVTHGNGPQLGFASLRSELAQPTLQRLPLDLSGATVQGELGYMIQQALRNEFRRRGIQRQTIAMVTQVLVDANDTAFLNPS